MFTKRNGKINYGCDSCYGKYLKLLVNENKKTFNLEIPNYKQSLEDCIKVIKNEA